MQRGRAGPEATTAALHCSSSLQVKHGYIPISFGKATYGGGKGSAGGKGSGKGGAGAPGGGSQPLVGTAEAAAKAGSEPRFTGSNLR